MKAILLSAGQGRRLLPWTHDLPKCLLPFAGRSLLAWQLSALAAAGLDRVVVVTGFAANAVEDEIVRSAPSGLAVETVHNPFFGVADNIASCWLVRDHLVGEVAMINGDTLFDPAMLARLRETATRPLTLAVDTKAVYDADDVKVQLLGDRVCRIGKTLSSESIGAEFVGMMLFRGLGGPLFAAAVETILAQPGGVSRWYLSALDELAGKGVVGATSVAGLSWTEVDYPGDFGRAELLTRQWIHRSRAETAAYPLAQ